MRTRGTSVTSYTQFIHVPCFSAIIDCISSRFLSALRAMWRSDGAAFASARKLLATARQRGTGRARGCGREEVCAGLAAPRRRTPD